MTKADLKKLELNKALDLNPQHPKITAIFLHGITSSAINFTKTFDYFKELPINKDIRFVAYDLLGAGDSPSGDDLDFGFEEQLAALENSIKKLNCNTPLVLVGHSMGTFIATRYSAEHADSIRHLILVSPPVFTEKDLSDPQFKAAMDGFKKVVEHKNPEALKSRVFNNEIELIVKNPKNYQFLAQISTPTTLIYGELDSIIASFNIPKLLKENSRIKVIKTQDEHNMSKEKNAQIGEVLTEVLDA